MNYQRNPMMKPLAVIFPLVASRNMRSRSIVRLAVWLGALMTWPLMALGIETEVIRQVANGRTVCLVQIDVGQLQFPQLESLQQLESALNELRQAVGDQPIIIAIDLPYGPGVDVVRIMTKSQAGKAEQLAKWLERYATNLNLGPMTQTGEWTTIGFADGRRVDNATATKPESSLPLELTHWNAAWKEAGNYPLQLAIVPPSYLRRAYQELEPELPKAMGGGPSRVLVDGLQWARLGLDPQSMKAQLRIHAENEQAANALAQHIPKMLRGAIEQLGSDRELPRELLLTMVGMVKPQVVGSQIVWDFDEAESTQQFLSLASLAIRTGARPMAVRQSSNNLKQLMLAFHNYESAFKTFPPHTRFRGPDGRSGLSWRVHILPFIDEGELYRQFKLDEPWDSPHNRPLLSRMPAIYKPVISIGEPNQVEPFHTLYAAPVGDKTIFGGDKAVTFGNITDGTSNTVAIVELAPEHALPWTAPEDYRFDPQAPAAKLYVRDGQVLAGFGDGSVRSLRSDNSPQVWNAVFSMNGGEMVEAK